MAAEKIKFGVDINETITLIPGGTIQFWDAEFEVEDSKLETIYFFEGVSENPTGREIGPEASGESGQGRSKLVYAKKITRDEYNSSFDDDSEYLDLITGKPYVPFDESSTKQQSYKKIDPLKRFAGRWVPIPFYRITSLYGKGEGNYKNGPTDWARIFVEEVTSTNGEPSQSVFRVVVAFDTHFEDASSSAALSADDVKAGAEFGVVPNAILTSHFLNLPWVKEWIRNISSVSNRKKNNQLENLACYSAFIEVLCGKLPHAKIADVFRDNVIPIEVDLVLDIGNARTIGMLCAASPGPTGGELGLDQSEVLEIRDLSHPTTIHGRGGDHENQTFRSVVCFSQQNFTSDAYPVYPDTGRRRPSFVWPSPVRVGKEATRLAALSSDSSSEGRTSLSSPKRYLWDLDRSKYKWLFAHKDQSAIVGPFFQHLRDDGIPTFAKSFDQKIPKVIRGKVSKNNLPAFEPMWSKSSFMMFLIAEIVTHALVQVNSPHYRNKRGNKEIPRRIRRIILTMPPAMTTTERKIYQQWTEWAIDILWKTQYWRSDDLLNRVPNSTQTNSDTVSAINTTNDFRRPPSTLFKLDEASATQLVFLYNELIEKHGGDSRQYLDLYGQKRDGGGLSGPLRIASVDVGGGTTDLVITDYALAASAGMVEVTPKTKFRESFNFAGDDLLKIVIEKHLIPDLENQLRNDRIREQLGGNDSRSSVASRRLRAQFAQQILQPLAIHILGRLEEKSDAELKDEDEKEIDIAVVEKIYQEADEQVRNYIFGNSTTKNDEAVGMWVPRVNLREVNEVIRYTIKPYLNNLLEVVELNNCDFLLVSGRPSCLPAVKTIFFKYPAVLTSRIIPMSEYAVGRWYPFHTQRRKIKDPKTTGVVGAALAAVNDGGLAKVVIRIPDDEPESTIRYLGILNGDNQIERQGILFDGVDLTSSREESREQEIQFNGTLRIGFRQFDRDRWKVTPFYLLRFVDEQARKKARNSSLKIRIAYDRVINEDGQKSITDEGIISISQITDIEGNELDTRIISATFMTMDTDTHWLDSGIFCVN